MIGRVAIGIRFFLIEQGAPPGKAVLDSMPVAYVGLADLPTKKHDFVTHHARKIYQSLFRPFAHAAVAVDFFHPTLDLSHEPSNLFVILQTFHEIRRVGIQVLTANDSFALAPQAANIL